jgi:DNA-binding XRE family transcriptional regulator
MPRRPKFIHPVRAVRTINSEAKGRTISQEAFAKMIGVSQATVQSVELGRLDVSTSLARRIGAVFAVDVESLLSKRGHPRDWRGHRYSVEWARNLTKLADVSQDQLEKWCEVFSSGVKGLLVAANHPNRKRLPVVNYALRDALAMVAKEFNLVKEWQSELIKMRQTNNYGASGALNWLMPASKKPTRIPAD